MDLYGENGSPPRLYESPRGKKILLAALAIGAVSVAF